MTWLLTRPVTILLNNKSSRLVVEFRWDRWSSEKTLKIFLASQEISKIFDCPKESYFWLSERASSIVDRWSNERTENEKYLEIFLRAHLEIIRALTKRKYTRYSVLDDLKDSRKNKFVIVTSRLEAFVVVVVVCNSFFLPSSIVLRYVGSVYSSRASCSNF